ncbi:MAG: L-2-hydroxyglutarate oxidase, partial [Mycobacteriaceae bacterium]
FVPATASVDYRRVCGALEGLVAGAGGRVELGVEVLAITESTTEVVIHTTSGDRVARQLVVCGGLQADRLARMSGIVGAARIVPFRGEYYQLPAPRRDLVEHLIYPIPDPALPFLGVHLTPMADGRVTVGPNAVLGLSREGYRKGSVDVTDVRDIIGFPGFWSLARRNLRTGAHELLNSASRRGFLHAARTYCPGLRLDDLQPYPAGIRAQAVAGDGTLLHDFQFGETARTLHVLNAPSPAATAAVPIGQRIARRALTPR